MPKNYQIVGTYKPDSFTKQDFKEFANSDSVILILKTNGEIQLKNFPPMVFLLPSDSSYKEISGKGTWSCYFNKMAKIKTQVEFEQKIEVEPIPFELYKKGDRYYILIPFGDPDVCSTVRLVQQ